MATTPFPVTGDTWEEARSSIMALLRDLFENRIGGAYVGDVFQIGGDVFELKLKAGSGLRKTGGELDIDVDTIGTNGAVMKSAYVDRGTILTASAPSTLIALTIGGDGQVLASNGADPYWRNFTAEEVPFEPSGGISAEDVQAAIEELDSEKVPYANPAFSGTVYTPYIAISSLTDTYIPKHANDSTGLQNSLLTDNGTDITLTGTGHHRCSTSRYRRYYHMPLGSANPGSSGATWVNASANTTGGWRLANASWVIRGQADVHSDWDGASDMTIEVVFMVNVDNTGGADTDTVDLRLNAYYKGQGDTAVKTQAVEVATVVGKSAQYKQFKAEFTIDYDAASNVVEAGDVIAAVLNLETDTSEVDDIVVTSMSFYYNTTHIGIERGDT